jgi:FkbM family methyltransferase
MNNIDRTGISLMSAFSGLARRADMREGQNPPTADSKSSEQPVETLDLPRNNPDGFKRRTKLLLRWLAAALYRLSKPFVRPLAYRARGFLLDAIRQHTSALSNELHVKLDRVVWHLASIESQIQHVRAEVQANQLKVSASIIQELQFMRELLERDLRETNASVEQALVQHNDDIRAALANLDSSLSPKLDRIEVYAYSNARRFAVDCGDGDVLVRTEAGYIMCSGSNDPAALAILIESGDLERGTRLLIQRLLKPHDLFIDVGANLGLHTIAAARAMQGRGKIIAFEPFPGTARLLGLSALINGFADIIEIHQAAVSTASGKRPLYLGQVSGHHSLFPHEVKSENKQQHIEVPLSRIDDFIDENEPVALIKIDVEGAELEVLKTAELTIQRNRDIAIIAEFGPSHLQAVGHDAASWLASFTSLGMEWRVIDADTGALEQYSFERLKGVPTANLFFARVGSPLLSG